MTMSDHTTTLSLATTTTTTREVVGVSSPQREPPQPAVVAASARRSRSSAVTATASTSSQDEPRDDEARGDHDKKVSAPASSSVVDEPPGGGGTDHLESFNDSYDRGANPTQGPSSTSRTPPPDFAAPPGDSAQQQYHHHHHDDPHHHNHNYHPRRSGVKRRLTRGPIQNPAGSSAILCGIAAGVAQAGLFNPYDRALYLSVRDRTSFLSRSNWTSPYAGFWQSLGGRALAGGLYYPLEHYFLRLLNRPGETRPCPNFVAGVLAGACNAMVMNPVTVVKYRTWSRGDQSQGWWNEAAYVLRNSGGSPRPFFNGLAPTLTRDVVFGGVYTTCRLQIQWHADLSPEQQWQGNMAAAGIATLLASPFNYARNVQYATSSRASQPGTVAILRHLAREVMQVDGGASWRRRLGLLQQRLRIGWGTLRVALGMSFAHSVYDALQKRIRPYE